MPSISESIGALRRIIGQDNREADWEVAGQELGLPNSQLMVERRSTDQLRAQVCKAIDGRLLVPMRGRMLRPRREHAVGYGRMRQS
jgi:hypothetical protein